MCEYPGTEFLSWRGSKARIEEPVTLWSAETIQNTWRSTNLNPHSITHQSTWTKLNLWWECMNEQWRISCNSQIHAISDPTEMFSWLKHSSLINYHKIFLAVVHTQTVYEGFHSNLNTSSLTNQYSWHCVILLLGPRMKNYSWRVFPIADLQYVTTWLQSRHTYIHSHVHTNMCRYTHTSL